MRPVSGKIFFFAPFLMLYNASAAQQQVTSFVTSNSSGAFSSYSLVKGAGLRSGGGGLASSWDSTGTSFTVNYGGGAASVTTVTQFTVSGNASPFIPIYSTSAQLKVRPL